MVTFIIILIKLTSKQEQLSRRRKNFLTNFYIAVKNTTLFEERQTRRKKKAGWVPAPKQERRLNQNFGARSERMKSNESFFLGVFRT